MFRKHFKSFLVDNMKKSSLNGYVYDFSPDHDAVAVDDILDIHKYLMKKMTLYKMFGFLKVFVAAMTFFSWNVLNVNLLKWVSMNNQECKIRPQIININKDNPLFYPYCTEVNKCSGSCNNINDPYAKLCVPDVVKNINVKVFNLVSRTNETRRIE